MLRRSLPILTVLAALAVGLPAPAAADGSATEPGGSATATEPGGSATATQLGSSATTPSAPPKAPPPAGHATLYLPDVFFVGHEAATVPRRRFHVVGIVR